ncbi:hypothetical protein WJX81_000836 [Elliptochloris bilobata]|uniref:Uncharacterized protein n=1 Tax=Elliptochloris bilobata TaxID=381761 RepID=A0AAW1S4E2_9CHLO
MRKALIAPAALGDLGSGKQAAAKPPVPAVSDNDSSLAPFVPWAIGLLVLTTIAAWGGIVINQFSTAPCALSPQGCTEIPIWMKAPLISTHLLAFGLMPTAMFVFYKRAPRLLAWGADSPITSIIGLSFLMVSIAGEMGWHVSQKWFYQEDYMILNAFFYLFLILGTALWALGIQDKETKDTPLSRGLDKVLLACAPLAMVAYGLGAAVFHTKVPIYIILSFEYAVLTLRFWRLLDKDPRVFLFPFFSVGVNLFFISLLNKYESDIILNPLFHILHDAAGTEMGVAIITALVYTAPARLLKPSEAK